MRTTLWLLVGRLVPVGIFLLGGAAALSLQDGDYGLTVLNCVVAYLLYVLGNATITIEEEE